ncbi:MAG: trigger factor [Planctomycetota bacterium]
MDDVGPCKKRVRIDVPAERVAEELDKAYEQLNDTVNVPGFRPGHAPRWLMESRFGKEVNGDTRDALMSDIFQEVVEANELKPIGTPEFEEDVELTPGEPLSFTVTLEVWPEFEIADYKGIKLARPPAEASEEEIDEQVEAFRRRYAALEDVDEGRAKEDDVAVCHVTLKEDGEVYRDVPDHQVIVGDHVLVGLDLEGTTELLTGLAVGETAEREIELPDDYPDADKQGATMTLELELERLRRPVLPELTDEWAESMGLDSVAELRDEIRSAIEERQERRTRRDLADQLEDKLVKQVDFELPEDVVNHMAERGVRRRQMALAYRGASDDEIREQEADLQKQSHESAERSTKLFFILNKIADKERIFVTEDEVNARLEAMAAGENRSAEQVRRRLEREGELSELRAVMRDEQVRSFLLDHADVQEAKPKKKRPAKKSGKARRNK